MAGTCKVSLSHMPCTGGGGLKLTRINASLKLKGISKAQFTPDRQSEFKEGVAATAGVSTSQVVILSITDDARRASSITVKYQVLIATTYSGDSSSLANSIQKKLKDHTSLQANIRKAAGAGSPLQNIEASGATADAPQESGTDGTNTWDIDTAALASWAIALIVIACLLCVGIPCCIFLCCFGGLACLGLAAASDGHGGSAHGTTQV